MHHNGMQQNLPQSIADRLAFKEKLLNTLAWKKKLIADLESNRKSPKRLLETDSSSEDEALEEILPSMRELKQQLNHENILLKAVEELTDLKILKKTIRVLPVPPEFEGEDAENTQQEEGTWKEVMVECKIESVIFNLHFFMFESGKQFEGPDFHNVTPSVLKKHQAVELEKSTLYSAATPSDAVDCLNRYAKAVRSRRETLRSLVEAYNEGLHIEQAEDGSIKCVVLNLLTIVWRLENSSSPLAAFRHRMTFDIEYMDEIYLRSIKSAFKTLRDPKLTTLDRTEILSSIINVCLQADRANRQTDGQTDTDVTTDTEQRKNVTLDHGDVGNTEIQELVSSTPKKLKVLSRRIDKHIDDAVPRKGDHAMHDDQGISGDDAPVNVNNKMFKIPTSPKKKTLNAKRPNTDVDSNRPNKKPKLNSEELADGSRNKNNNFQAAKDSLNDVVNPKKNLIEKITKNKSSQQKSGNNIFAKLNIDKPSDQQNKPSQIVRKIANEKRGNEVKTQQKETKLSEERVKAMKKDFRGEKEQQKVTKSSIDRERVNEAQTEEKETKSSGGSKKAKNPDLPGEKEQRKETKVSGGSKSPIDSELTAGINPQKEIHVPIDKAGGSKIAKRTDLPKKNSRTEETEVTRGNKKLKDLKLPEETKTQREKFLIELSNQEQNDGKDIDKNSKIVNKGIRSQEHNKSEVTRQKKVEKRTDLVNVPDIPESHTTNHDEIAIINTHSTKPRNIFGTAFKNSFAVNIAFPAKNHDNPKKSLNINTKNKQQVNKPIDSKQTEVSDSKVIKNKGKIIKPVTRMTKPLNTINKNVPIIRSQSTNSKESNVDLNKENPKVAKKIIANPKTGEKIILKQKIVRNLTSTSIKQTTTKALVAQTSQKIPRPIPPRKLKQSHIPVLKSRLEESDRVSHVSGKF